jgi:hypothetical protein
MMDKYIVVSQQEWDEQAGTDPGFLHTRSVLSMEDAGKAANGLATRRQVPYYVVKLVPVSLHRATIDIHVDQL